MPGEFLQASTSMTVHEPTLTTVLGLVSLAASAMFFALAAFARQIPGVRHWAIGCLAIGFATILDGPRFIADWQLASLLFNIPFSVGQAFMLAGTLDLCKRARAQQLLPALSTVAVLVTVTFTYFYPNTAWRIGSLSMYQTVINLVAAWVMLRYRDAFSRRVFRIAGVVAALQALAAFVQGTLVVTSVTTFSYGAPQFPLANIISWAGALLSAVVGNSMLMLLIMLRLVAELRSAADRDLLTGLLNRRGIRPKFDKLMARDSDSLAAVGVLLLDIDFFKQVNDTYGHESGDRVLAIMGAVLLSLKSAKVTPCRWGGEEFCLVVEEAVSDSLVELAERIRAQFARQTAALPGLQQGRTVSVGVALSEQGVPLEVAKLIAAADAQLYRAKQSGRNRVMVA